MLAFKPRGDTQEVQQKGLMSSNFFLKKSVKFQMVFLSNLYKVYIFTEEKYSLYIIILLLCR